MGKVIELNKQTAETKINNLLNKVDEIYGLEGCKEILENYTSYIKMRKEGKVSFGTYNILIKNKSNYNTSQELVDIIWKILKESKLISTSYRYIERDELMRAEVDGNKPNKFKELLVINTIDSDISTRNYKKYIKELINKYPQKIFVVIINNERVEDIINYTELLTWNLDIERISKDNKVDYIKKILKENKISIENNSNFIDILSEKPYWKVKNEMLNIILKCKIKNIKQLTNTVLVEELKCKYGKKLNYNNISNNPLKDLHSMIGMSEIKEQIMQVVNYIKVNKKRKNMPMLHMVFEGNPGTGKTTVARIVGQIFNEMQFLSENGKFIEAHRADLIAEYVGQTAPKTERIIERANGGVLFIDEAYSLSTYIQDEAWRDYGSECIATLLKGMEDKRDSLCVIMAGYTKEMKQLLNSNPGLESRIQFKITFPDYKELELYEIFKKMAKNENYKLTSNIREVLVDYFKIEKQKENFANARCVRNIFEKVKFEQANRVLKTAESLNTIKKIDIVNVIKNLNKECLQEDNNKRKIGFAC